MTLSPFFFLSQKSNRKDFLFTYSLIEIFKRDYFYPIFAEIYRRKGFLAIADLLDLFSKRTSNNVFFLEQLSLVISTNLDFSSELSIAPSLSSGRDGIKGDLDSHQTWSSPEEGPEFLVDEISIKMHNLLKTSIQEAISPRANFYNINKVFLNCLRFNSEQFYPSLMLYVNNLIKNADQSLCINGLESSLLLTSIVDTEIKNFRLLEKKLYF